MNFLIAAFDNVQAYDEQCLRELIDLAFKGNQASPRSQNTPEFNVLISRHSMGTAPDHVLANAHLRAGTEFRDRGEFPAAHAHYRAAFAHTAPELDALLYIAAAWMVEGRHKTAADLLECLLLQDDQRADIRNHLAHALWNSGNHTGALDQCDILLLKHRDDPQGLDTVRIMHSQRGNPAKALDACLALASAESTLPARRADYLFEASLLSVKAATPLPEWHGEAAAAIAAPTEEQLKAAAALEVLRLRSSSNATWRALFTERGQLSHTLPSPDRDTLTSFLAAEPPARVLSLADEPSLSAIFGGGWMQTEALQQDGFTLNRNPGVLERGWMTTDKDERVVLNIAAARVQLKIIASGEVELHSPFGGVVTSSTSFVLNYDRGRRECGSVIAYFFSSPRPSFVFFASEDFWPLAWYDPIENVILLHEGMQEFSAYLQDRVRELKLVCLADPAAAAAYIEAAPSRAGGQSTLLFGLMDYLSTYLFSDLGGILRVLDNGVLEKVDSIVVLAPEPIEQLEILFPELRPSLIDRQPFADVCAVNHHLWTTNSFAVRATGGFVTDELAGRIVQSAKRNVSQEWREQIDVLNQDCFPVIFVALRAHGRRWLASSKEIAGIFTQLRDRYPRLALIFDGHAATHSPVQPAIAEGEANLINSICAELPPDTRVLISAGRDMADGIYAACMSDCHLSAQGTTATKAALIGGRPGVIVGSRQFGWDVRAFREPCPELITPWQHAVDQIEGDIQCDYTLDPEIVAAALLTIVRDLIPRDHL